MRWTRVLFDISKVGDLTKQWSNLPDSYIKRSMEQIVYRTPRRPEFQRRSDAKKKIMFTMNRPWTMQSRLENPLDKNAKIIYVEPIKEWKIFRGDRVEILSGKDKGKQGIVEMVYQERNWVTVQNLNTKMKVLKTKNGCPVIVNLEEQPLRVTDEVTLIDPTDMLPCEIEWRFTEKGERIRVSKRTGRVIPMPRLAQETVDFKSPGAYEDQPKDTSPEIVEKVTFQPKLRTFEMDVMEEHGIKDDRVQAPFYWY